MKINTGKKRFLQDAVEYIKANGPSTAEQLHDGCRYTVTGKLLRDSPSRPQVQQILARSKLFKSDYTEVAYPYSKDNPRYTTYPVKQYSLVGEE